MNTRVESLNDRLTALRLEKEAKRDPAVTELMQRGTEELRASGVLERVRQVGVRAPLFARPSLAGETVRLRSLLRSGPVGAELLPRPLVTLLPP